MLVCPLNHITVCKHDYHPRKMLNQLFCSEKLNNLRHFACTFQAILLYLKYHPHVIQFLFAGTKQQSGRDRNRVNKIHLAASMRQKGNNSFLDKIHFKYFSIPFFHSSSHGLGTLTSPFNPTG